MAKVKISGFIEEMEAELKKAIELALIRNLEEGTYDSKAIIKTFKTQFIDRCNSWESIPNKYIKNG